MEANQPQNKRTVYDVFNEYHTHIESQLEILHESLPFLKDGINLIIGESKAGKTYSTIKCLVDCGFKEQIIHIDFDRNADSRLKQLDVQTYHINNVEGFINSLNELGEQLLNELKDKILIIDSLQDLSLGDGVDSNSGALNTMKRVQGFKDTGATIIVIHHVTLDADDKPKVKGNASVITSKSDTTISFVKKDSTTRTMKVLNTRAEDKIPSAKVFTFKNELLTTDKGKSSVPK